MPYFVRITPRSPRARLEGSLYGSDLGEESLIERVVDPYRRGESITLGGRTIAAPEISTLKITFAGDAVDGVPLAQLRAARPGARTLGDHIARHGEDVTDRYIDGPPGQPDRTLADGDPGSTDGQEAAPRTDQGEVPAAGGWRGRTRWLRSRLRTPIGIIVGLVGLLGALASIIALFLVPHPADSPGPEAERLLDLIPPKVGWHCRPEATATAMRYPTAVAASAVCTPVDGGPESLSFELFTTETEMREILDLESRRAQNNGVGCDRDFTTQVVPWTNNSGGEGGEMFCSDVDKHIRRTHLTWTDDRKLITGEAGAEPDQEERLHRWWQRDVRFDGRGPDPQAAARLATLAPGWIRECRRDPILLSAAGAGARCNADGEPGTAGISLFPNRALLDRYFASRTAFRGALRAATCRTSPLGLGGYGIGASDHRAAGELLCYRDAGREWFEWTDIADDTYAYASIPADRWRLLYREWSREPGS